MQAQPILVRRRTIPSYQEEVHTVNSEKGWWDGYDRDPVGGHVRLSADQMLAKLALVTTEVSEAIEDVRDGKMLTSLAEGGKPVGFPSELADIVIRVLDIAESQGINLEQEIVLKLNYNKTRPQRHGGKKA